MKEYRVYFRQINQTKYEVEALDEKDAIKIARKQWREEFAEPDLLGVEE